LVYFKTPTEPDDGVKVALLRLKYFFFDEFVVHPLHFSYQYSHHYIDISLLLSAIKVITSVVHGMYLIFSSPFDQWGSIQLVLNEHF
jgi:hypothetical protein